MRGTVMESTIDVMDCWKGRQVRRSHAAVYAKRAGSRQRRREVVRDERIVLVATLILAGILVIGFLISGSVRTEAAPSEVRSKYYTSIQIEQGDTLWEIAGRYMTDEYKDVNAYIQEVCAMNHISGDQIHAGQYLTVPYYATEPFCEGETSPIQTEIAVRD